MKDANPWGRKANISREVAEIYEEIARIVSGVQKDLDKNASLDEIGDFYLFALERYVILDLKYGTATTVKQNLLNILEEWRKEHGANNQEEDVNDLM